MIYKTHEMAGALAMEMVMVESHATLHWWTPVLVVAAGLVAPVPDIDEPESWIAHKIPFGGVVGRVVRHRTITHSLLALIVLWVVLIELIHFRLPFGLHWTTLAWAIFIGYASHTFIDLFNPQGVQLLWPLPWWIKVLPEPLAVPVESGREQIVYAALTIATVLVGLSFIIAHQHWHLPIHAPRLVHLARHILSVITI